MRKIVRGPSFALGPGGYPHVRPTDPRPLTSLEMRNVPLNRPALALGSGPSGVHEARRWVTGTCVDIGRPDLVECAEIGVSELVTNAILHGRPPISVRVRGTREHPHIEVMDSSCEPPVLPGADHLGDDVDFLLTFGRGLDIVGRCSEAWGAEIEEDGKVVWFTPATEPSEDGSTQGVITGLVDTTVDAPDPAELVEINIPDVPLRAFLDFQVHYRELRREVRLLSLAHQGEFPLAKTLSDLFDSLDRVLREGIGTDQLESVISSGQETADLRVVMPASTASSIGHYVELLDLADQFCLEQRMLTLARSPEQKRFQEWFLGEFVRQQRGERSRTWSDGSDRVS
jgi:anti-sigma regulatory factor (Ser/Thr protein kinase)